MSSIKLDKYAPAYTNITDDIVTIGLVYGSIHVEYKGTVMVFTPMRGKHIRINVATGNVLNLDTEFVFKSSASNFKSITLGELLSTTELLSDLEKNINTVDKPLLKDGGVATYIKLSSPFKPAVAATPPLADITTNLIIQLEQENRQRLIDKALREGDKATFMALTGGMK